MVIGIRFEKGSYAETILLYVLFAGEFPYRSLYLIPKDQRILKRTILKMKKEGYLHVVGSGDLKTIRIRKKAFPVVENLFGNKMLDYYLSITDNHHFRGDGKTDKGGTRRVWRKHRIAETLSVFKQLGVSFLPIDKELLSKDDIIFPNPAVYYSSLEMKRFLENEKTKFDFTRILGALFTQSKMFCVYNTNKGMMKWNNQGEQKAQMMVQRIAKNSISTKALIADSAIVFAKDLIVGLDLLYQGGQKRKKDALGFELLSFDNVFSNIHFLPLDQSGIVGLYLLLQDQFIERVAKAFFEEPDFTNIDTAGIHFISSGQRVFSFLDNNISMMKKLKDAMSIFKIDHVVILCFEYQYNFLFDYFRNNVQYRIVKESDVLSLF